MEFWARYLDQNPSLRWFVAKINALLQTKNNERLLFLAQKLQVFSLKTILLWKLTLKLYIMQFNKYFTDFLLP